MLFPETAATNILLKTAAHICLKFERAKNTFVWKVEAEKKQVLP